MEFERAADVLEGVEKAPSLGIAAPVMAADLAPRAGRSAVVQSRIRAARSWLFALGYLASDEDLPDYDDALEEAVSTFQREAGLTVDGWIGAAETWPRLQELVAFEQPLDPAFWADEEGEPKPGLSRAVATRLRLYGAAPEGPGRVALETAVRRFFEMNRLVGAPEEGIGFSTASWFAGVLDHDRHVRAAVAGGVDAGDRDRVRTLMSQGDDDPDAVAGVSLLLNMAKIELWLAQGEGVELGRPMVARRRLGGPWVLPMLDAMRAYMAMIDEDYPEAEDVRAAFAASHGRGERIRPLILFLDAAQRFGMVDDPFAPERVRQLQAFYGGEANRVPRRAQATVKALTEPRSLRARLWDGVRRLWAWIGRALRKVGQGIIKALMLARNLAGYAFRVATDGLVQLTRAIGSFVRHAGTAIRRRHADPSHRVLVAREFGRDVNVLSATGTPQTYVATFAESLRLSAGIFRRACGILGRALKLGISVLGISVAGPLILRTLIAAVVDLVAVVRLAREINTLEARYERVVSRLSEA